MKVRHKLILGYLLVAVFASLTTYFTIGSYQNIRSVFDEMVKNPLPTIKALEGMSEGGVKIVASTSEFGFIHNEAVIAQDKSLKSQEEEVLESESGRRQFVENLEAYRTLISSTDSPKSEFYNRIKTAGDKLIETSNEIIEMKKRGEVGEAVLEIKEDFEDREISFLGIVNEAKENEYRELAREQERVEATIAESTRRTLSITLLTFMLAIAGGYYISRQLSRRIIELKEASREVSNGELETLVRVESGDEIGDLGRSFNKMVGDLKESRTALLSSKKFVDNIFDSMPDILVVLNIDGTINRVNRGMLKLTGYSEWEIVGKDISLIDGDAELFPQRGFEELKRKGFTTGIEKHCLTKSKELIPVAISVSVLRDMRGKAIGFVGVAQNISERKVLETKLTHQALHDPLTGLANRVLFHNRVEHALALAARSRSQLAVLFLDLDNFKNINDSLGHAAGDELLKGVAARISSCLRASDTAARLGGDEFALLLEQLSQDDYAATVAERVIEELREPFLIGGKEIFIQTSVGIASSEFGAESPEELLRNADVAMYISKSRGKGRATVFEPHMHRDLIDRLELEADLRNAIEAEEFSIVYQPIIEFKTGRIKAIESLVRWHHPKRGLIMPLDFIPIAEDTGLIVPLGKWILQRACRQAQKWNTDFPSNKPLEITVNLSARQFQHPEIVDMVGEAIAASGLPAQLLVLEITESLFLQSTDSMIEKLNELKKLGVRLAVDDFGTGYSSLSYLNRFPVDIIKIDRAFINKIEKTGKDAAVAKAIIQMSDTLRLKTIAEGIENRQQSELLKKMGCEFGQGYLFAYPLNENDFTAFLTRSGVSLDSAETEHLPLIVQTEFAEKIESAA